jgi:DNA-binding CsgD family transcriptional regulator
VAGTAFLERDGDVRRLEELLAGAREGRGGLTVVEGPAGIGKTALLGAAREAAERHAMAVLRARGAELEREYAYGVVRQLFEPALAGAPPEDREGLLAGAAGIAVDRLGLLSGEPAEGATLPDATFSVLHGLYWLCANLAHRSPLVLLVDDVHWADAASVRFLTFLATRLEELPIVVCLATRPELHGVGGDLLVALLADPSTASVRPAPLTPAAVSELIEVALGVPPDPAFAQVCHAVTGGRPFFLRQLITVLREESVAPTAAAAETVERQGARGVRRWVLLRIARLSPEAGRLARALAILERAPLRQAAALAELDPAAAADAADELAAAGIVEGERPLSFEHAVVRTAVYEELSTLERSQGHRRAAELAAAEPEAAGRVAEHLLAAEPAGEAWIAERLESAAASAARAGAPESAIAYLERALAEPPPAERRPHVLMQLGLAEMNAGSDAAAAHLEAAAAGFGEPSARVEAALVLALIEAREGRCGAALSVLDGVADDVTALGPAAELMVDIAAVSIGLLDAGTASTVAARAARLRAHADAADAPRELLGLAAYLAGNAGEPAATVRALAERTLADGAVPTPADLAWFPQATVALVYAEGYDEALTAYQGAFSAARASGDGVLMALAGAQRGWALLRLGDLLGAELDARGVLETPALPAPPLYQALALGVLVGSLQEQGALMHADAAMAPFARLAEHDTQTSAVLRFARGQLRAAQHRFGAAADDLRAVGRIALATGAPSPGNLPWRSALAVALAGDGDGAHGEARALAEEEVELARAAGLPRALGIALRAAALTGPEGAREERLREALAAHERAQTQVELAQTRLELGAFLRRDGRRDEARTLLREALEAADRARARPLATRAEEELRATGARPRRVALSGVDALTASEKRIAGLAAEGLTNREIAEALYVTARTVEGHLTSVFRKLAVPSREALPDALAGASG